MKFKLGNTFNFSSIVYMKISFHLNYNPEVVKISPHVYQVQVMYTVGFLVLEKLWNFQGLFDIFPIKIMSLSSMLLSGISEATYKPNSTDVVNVPLFFILNTRSLDISATAVQTNWFHEYTIHIFSWREYIRLIFEMF